MAWNGTVLNKGAIPNPGRSACRRGSAEDSTAVSIFVVILVELTNTVFVNSTIITTYVETAALSTQQRPHLETRYPNGFVPLTTTRAPSVQKRENLTEAWHNNGLVKNTSGAKENKALVIITVREVDK